MAGAAHSLAAIPVMTAPSAVHELAGLRVPSAAGRAFSSSGTTRSASRSAATRCGRWRSSRPRRVARRRRHADHLRRPAIESRPRHRDHRGAAGSPLHPRAQRRSGRRGPLRPATCSSTRWPAPKSATCGRATSAIRRWQRAADDVRRRGGRPCDHPARRVHAARRRGVRVGDRRAARSRSIRRRHRPRLSSGGTQAGLVAGCMLAGLADARHRHQRRRPDARRSSATMQRLLAGLRSAARRWRRTASTPRAVEVDDRFIGDGYGVPTAASREALSSRRDARASFSITPIRPRPWPA